MRDALTLVLDIGKSHAKLLMIDTTGEVVERHGRDNHAVMSPLGYPALDVHGLAAWITDTLAGLAATRRCTRAITSTHGAALAALGEGGLAWDPIDYEFEGIAATDTDYRRDRDDVEATLAPDLPAGLNVARQIHWLQHTHPQAWARTQTLLPYPQYWAWWLSGVAATEVSSLGAHTQLWRPALREYTLQAQRHGWAAMFAPRCPAWQVLGHVRPDRARALGLPETCAVFTGLHDSNACLARYLRERSQFTLVSTGTWVIVMAPGAATSVLDPARDMIGNVSVRGEIVPTARFMGGRELQALCLGASPSRASLAALERLLAREVMALPTFAGTGGPFMGQHGQVLEAGRVIDAPAALDEAERASLAALYNAEVSAWVIERLGAISPVVLEGPFADNPVYVHALASLLPAGALHLSTDPLEGTARGAWLLTRWSDDDSASRFAPALKAVDTPERGDAVRGHHARWMQRVALREASLSR